VRWARRGPAGGFGPGPFGPSGFGFGGPGGRSGGRARRGDVRSALLIALLDGPAHGYQLIQTLSEKSGGVWQPSPGAVYPSLEALFDEGLVTSGEEEGRRVFTLTDAGRTAAEERKEQGAPWQRDDEAIDPRAQLHQAAFALFGAAKQVSMTGTQAQIDAATGIIDEARKSLYKLLAES